MKSKMNGATGTATDVLKVERIAILIASSARNALSAGAESTLISVL